MNFTLEEFKKKYHYSPLAGVFEKKVGSKRKGYKWVLIGFKKDTSGYMWLSVFGKSVAAHRLAWFCVHGE